MKKPYFLIVALLLILVFLIGVRHGQRVERTNKIIDYLISLTPSPSITLSPSSNKLLPTITSVSRRWGITLFHPENLTIKESTTAPVIFIDLKDWTASSSVKN
ncbi:MAG: hypothetical protein NZL96_03945 [Patescibacteria group bacterium]|nr:hypothetical protein [Patescibacteria group bacterium]